MMAKEKELEKKRKDAAVAAKKAKEAMELSEKLAAEVLALEKEVSTVSVSSTEAGPPAKKDVQAKKDSSSDSSDSENDSEDSDEQEAPKNVASKTKEVEATKETNKKDEDSNDSSSDSDSSSSSSSSDDDADKVKETETVDAKKAETKADKENDDESSGSSSDSDSDSGDDEDGDKEEMKQTDEKEGKTKTKLADVKATPVKEASGNKRGASAFSPEDDKRQATTKIYVRGLPWRASEEEIREYFMACGEIESLELPLQDDGRSSGTAVITFKEAAGSSAAIELNGSDFQGRWLSIKYSTPKPTMTPKSTSEKPTDCKTIFVGNLSFQIDEDTLRDAFKECGEISMVRFATDRETGDFKGFGHIEFVDSDAVDKAMAMAGTDILGRAVRIDFAEDKRRGSFGDRGGGGGRGRFGGGGGRAEYMGKGGGGRKGSGRQGRGRGDNRSGGGMAKAKKTGAIAEFSGSKITF